MIFMMPNVMRKRQNSLWFYDYSNFFFNLRHITNNTRWNIKLSTQISIKKSPLAVNYFTLFGSLKKVYHKIILYEGPRIYIFIISLFNEFIDEERDHKNIFPSIGRI